MKTAIVISSVGRPHTLHETVAGLSRQTIAPAAILISLCDTRSLLEETTRLPLVRVIFGAKGLTKQRNASLAQLPAEAEYVLFLDDDVELAANYLENMEHVFDAQPDIALASGGICRADGPRLGRVVSREEAVEAVSQHRCEDNIFDSEGAYGCNMFVRRSVLQAERFDERLPLESWLEDYDFSVRCGRHGRVVWNLGTCAAHIGVRRVAREKGFVVGYSQIANSYYLWRKGVISSVGRLLRNFWLPSLRVSVQGTLRPKAPWTGFCDYRGRLRGNVRALLDAVSFRLRPERILELIGQQAPEKLPIADSSAVKAPSISK